MKIGLIDTDGHNFPNLAPMKISAYHKALGDDVEFALLSVCDVIYVGTKYGISNGMETEIFKARRLGLEEICLN